VTLTGNGTSPPQTPSRCSGFFLFYHDKQTNTQGYTTTHLGEHRGARRTLFRILLALHAATRGLGLCACLLLFVLRRASECQVLGEHRGVRRILACMLLALHAATWVLGLCACLLLFVQCVCVLGFSVLPPAPLRRRRHMPRRWERTLRCRCMF